IVSGGQNYKIGIYFGVALVLTSVGSQIKNSFFVVCSYNVLSFKKTKETKFPNNLKAEFSAFKLFGNLVSTITF
ncbi:hypothetical protein KJ992_01285, partial [Patescibacteria group bacterium]|nr:hypothetical protein [Patescibacteria group bacterium]